MSVCARQGLFGETSKKGPSSARLQLWPAGGLSMQTLDGRVAFFALVERVSGRADCENDVIGRNGLKRQLMPGRISGNHDMP